MPKINIVEIRKELAQVDGALLGDLPKHLDLPDPIKALQAWLKTTYAQALPENKLKLGPLARRLAFELASDRPQRVFGALNELYPRVSHIYGQTNLTDQEFLNGDFYVYMDGVNPTIVKIPLSKNPEMPVVKKLEEVPNAFQKLEEIIKAEQEQAGLENLNKHANRMTALKVIEEYKKHNPRTKEEFINFFKALNHKYSRTGFTGEPYSELNALLAQIAWVCEPGSQEGFWKLLYPEITEVETGISNKQWPRYGEAILSEELAQGKPGAILNYRQLWKYGATVPAKLIDNPRVTGFCSEHRDYWLGVEKRDNKKINFKTEFANYYEFFDEMCKFMETYNFSKNRDWEDDLSVNEAGAQALVDFKPFQEVLLHASKTLNSAFGGVNGLRQVILNVVGVKIGNQVSIDLGKSCFQTNSRNLRDILESGEAQNKLKGLVFEPKSIASAEQEYSVIEGHDHLFYRPEHCQQIENLNETSIAELINNHEAYGINLDTLAQLYRPIFEKSPSKGKSLFSVIFQINNLTLETAFLRAFMGKPLSIKGLINGASDIVPVIKLVDHLDRSLLLDEEKQKLKGELELELKAAQDKIKEIYTLIEKISESGRDFDDDVRKIRENQAWIINSEDLNQTTLQMISRNQTKDDYLRKLSHLSAKTGIQIAKGKKALMDVFLLINEKMPPERALDALVQLWSSCQDSDEGKRLLQLIDTRVLHRKMDSGEINQDLPLVVSLLKAKDCSPTEIRSFLFTCFREDQEKENSQVIGLIVDQINSLEDLKFVIEKLGREKKFTQRNFQFFREKIKQLIKNYDDQVMIGSAIVQFYPNPLEDYVKIVEPFEIPSQRSAAQLANDPVAACATLTFALLMLKDINQSENVFKYFLPECKVLLDAEELSTSVELFEHLPSLFTQKQIGTEALSRLTRFFEELLREKPNRIFNMFTPWKPDALNFLLQDDFINSLKFDSRSEARKLDDRTLTYFVQKYPKLRQAMLAHLLATQASFDHYRIFIVDYISTMTQDDFLFMISVDEKYHRLSVDLVFTAESIRKKITPWISQLTNEQICKIFKKHMDVFLELDKFQSFNSTPSLVEALFEEVHQRNILKQAVPTVESFNNLSLSPQKKHLLFKGHYGDYEFEFGELSGQYFWLRYIRQEQLVNDFLNENLPTFLTFLKGKDMDFFYSKFDFLREDDYAKFYPHIQELKLTEAELALNIFRLLVASIPGGAGEHADMLKKLEPFKVRGMSSTEYKKLQVLNSSALERQDDALYLTALELAKVENDQERISRTFNALNTICKPVEASATTQNPVHFAHNRNASTPNADPRLEAVIKACSKL